MFFHVGAALWLYLLELGEQVQCTMSFLEQPGEKRGMRERAKSIAHYIWMNAEITFVLIGKQEDSK